jgi:hypothetical protein
MSDSLKHYKVRHSVYWDVNVIIDPSKVIGLDPECFKDLAEKIAGSWADDQHYHSWTFTKNIADYVVEVDGSDDQCHACIMPEDDHGLEYATALLGSDTTA